MSEGKGDEFLVGTSRNFILRGTFNDGFLVVVQVRICNEVFRLRGDAYELSAGFCFLLFSAMRSGSHR